MSRRRLLGVGAVLLFGGAAAVGAGVAGQQLVAAGPPAPADASASTGISDPSDRAAHPTDRWVIGRSLRGQEIVATAYGDPSATRVLALIGSMHGSEPAGVGVVDLVARTGAPTGSRIWVVRTVNPDGLAAGTRANASGVDINRNTPHRWRRARPGGPYYPGPSPSSEPETRAYMAFLSDLSPDLVLSFHQDLNGVDSYGNKDRALIAWLGKQFGLPVKSFACTGVCRGTLTGWFNATHKGSAVTIELPGRVRPRQTERLARSIGRIASGMRDAG